MRMKSYLLGSLFLLPLFFSCEVFAPQEPEEYELLDGPVVDWNVGRFKETDTKIGDHILAVTPGISCRPTPKTVFRINYRYEWQTDILNNPAKRAATWYMGFSSYF